MERTMIECVVIAGFGGMMPTLTRLGSALVTDPNLELPNVGFLLGLLIYFVIGSILAYAFCEKNLKQAFLTGIAAPALIASVVAGVQEGKIVEIPNSVSYGEPQSYYQRDWGIIASACAQEGVAFSEATRQSEESTVSKQESTQYEKGNLTYTFTTNTYGSHDWRPSALSYYIEAQTASGESQNFYLGQHAVAKVVTEEPIVSIRVVAPQCSQAIQLDKTTYAGAIVDIGASVHSKKDIWWALGGRGKPEVKDLNIEVAPKYPEDTSPNHQIQVTPKSGAPD